MSARPPCGGGGTARPAVPGPLAAVLARLPPYPGSFAFCSALNAVLRPQLPADVAASLEGRVLRIAVTDARVAFDFTWRDGRFRALPRGGPPALEIAAGAADFLALARREEDPDTLFFGRRLAMSGDTELGLLVKNTLDALDLPLPALVRTALAVWLRPGPAR